MKYYAIIDCDNCYVSCERVFRPDLNGKPVVVLSNNDGCVVARSNEVKQMGVKAGTPYFKLARQFPGQEIAVFSSNYELYGDLTGRVMSIIQQEAPEYFRYSIDEAFAVLRDLDGLDLKAWGEQLHQRIRRCVGMPVSIGIAPTKTLAKMASHYAKHYAGYRHCCLIDTDEKRRKALTMYPVSEVWGIGRRHAERLARMGIRTAEDFAAMSRDEVQSMFHVTGLRTWRELGGEDCIPTEEAARKKSICVSRSFPAMISDVDELRRYVSNYAAHCAEKLRKQGTAASVVGVFLDTNPFREDLPQYGNYSDLRLLTPTSSSITLVQKAVECLLKVYREGYQYKRAGVVAMSMECGAGIQTDLLDYDAEQFGKMQQLDKVMDKINKVNGAESVIIASQQFRGKGTDGKATQFADAIRHDHRSPSYTTRWSDIIDLV